MQKNYIIIGVVALLILGGAGAYFFAKSNTPKQEKIITEQKKASEVFKGLDINKGVKCQQTVSVGKNNSIHSIMYFYKNKMRYDTEIAQEAQGQKDLHIISDGEYSYMWGKSMIGSAMGGAYGMKMKADDENAPEPDIDVEELKKHDFQMPNIKCEEWRADKKLFELPKDIEFKDMNEMMKPMMDAGANQGAIPNADQMCAMCDMIPDAKAKEECKKSCK